MTNLRVISKWWTITVKNDPLWNPNLEGHALTEGSGFNDLSITRPSGTTFVTIESFNFFNKQILKKSPFFKRFPTREQYSGARRPEIEFACFEPMIPANSYFKRIYNKIRIEHITYLNIELYILLMMNRYKGLIVFRSVFIEWFAVYDLWKITRRSLYNEQLIDHITACTPLLSRSG